MKKINYEINQEIKKRGCVCNYCGKKYKGVDALFQNNSFHHVFGYGSKRDLTDITFTLCCECMDTLTDRLIDECVIKPTVNDLIFGF